MAEPRLQATCAEILVEFRRVILEIRWRTEPQTYLLITIFGTATG